MGEYPALDLTYRPSPGSGELLDLIYAALDDFEPLAIHEHDTADGLRVFFRSSAGRDGALAGGFGADLQDLSPVEVADDGWARKSQAQLTPVRVGRILVMPPWAGPAAQGEIPVVIEPSMGFGTGHHPTTRLCLRLLQQLTLADRRVMDVGTGSGVLAIAAWKLGARDVTAVDCDPDALQNARENVERNGAAVTLVQADLGALHETPADVVLANLTTAVLQRYAGTLRALVRPGGRLIVSGFNRSDLESIGRALGIGPSAALDEDAWTAAAFDITAPTPA